MRTVKLAAAMLAIAMLAGCKLNLTAEVYSTDLRDAMAGTAGIVAPATMAFQVLSAEDCDAHIANIRNILAGVLRDFTPKGCKVEDMESFLLADTRIPVFTSAEAWSQADSLFGILLTKGRNPAHIFVSIVLFEETTGGLAAPGRTPMKGETQGWVVWTEKGRS